MNYPDAAKPDHAALRKWNSSGVLYVLPGLVDTREKRTRQVATDYDEVRSDVKESQQNSLQALRSANAPDARSVVMELDEADGLDGAGVPGGEFIAEELTVQVIPQAEDEFTCNSCFMVRHRSQIARQKGGHAYCTDCEG
jgi:hypothetical protein